MPAGIAGEEKTPVAAPVAPVADDASKKPAVAKDDPAARAAFEADYEAGVAAVAANNWPVVKQKMASALKALGEQAHPRKSAAQVLLNKSERSFIKEDAFVTANELARLKQWVEAEEAYRKVVDVFGETETLKKHILECRNGLEADNDGIKKANELLKEKKWKEALEAYNKVSDTLGGIRAIREGIANANLGIESDVLLKRGAEQLKNKKWNDAFDTYKRLVETIGQTDEVRKGIAAAQAGYAEEHKPAPLAEKVEGSVKP